jgi:Pyruvate/2-oxoacid:ferredoxin oxidoreductase delta subunit
MPTRKVITIDEEKCDGCGECVTSCAEGAIAVVDGKARLVSETYCDGLGACLGHCPQGAISIEERQAEAFDEVATREHLRRIARPAGTKTASPAPPPVPHACPSTMLRMLNSLGRGNPAGAAAPAPATASAPSELTNWPVQLMLVPPHAPYLRDADILLVADCVPFAYADFHRRFLRGRPVIIGCPKLDSADFYVKKLAQILQTAQPRSISILRMEVPCCSGLTRIAQLAMQAVEAKARLEEVVVSIQGEVLETELLEPRA